MKIKIKRLRQSLPMPTYAHATDAGFDLYTSINFKLKSMVKESDRYKLFVSSFIDNNIDNKHKVIVPTGIAVEIPEGYAGFIYRRSSLAAKGISVVGTGVIDSGYRGEIKVVMMNLSHHEHVFKRGDRIAQLVIQPIVTATLEEVEEFEESDRGENGFGSTGR